MSVRARMIRLERRCGTSNMTDFDLWLQSLTDGDLSAVIAFARECLSATGYDASDPPQPDGRPMTDEEAAELIAAANSWLADLRSPLTS